MTKFIKASEILKEKGYKPPKFNADQFLAAVSTFFRQNEATARLILFPVPMSAGNGFSDEDVKNGFSLKSKDEIRSVLECIGFSSNINHDVMYIDRPFIKNAAALLTIMCGFIVENEKVNGKNVYVASLV